ncbi:MAG: DUF1640 domain-containing protein [Magnetococcales bacterium]|nr:DUF1640 domain-containing protein [Magnetococcales bacterium]
MTIAAFDTLEFVESLETSGFTKEQSKGMVSALKKVQDAQLEELATKGDLREAKLELKSDLRELETRLTGQLTLVKWMLALVIAVTVLPAIKALLG